MPKIAIELTMPIRLTPKIYFAKMKTKTLYYVSEERHRCPSTTGAALYPRIFQTFSSTFQTRKPALRTSTQSDFLPASFVAIVSNTKALLVRHIPSLVAPPSIVAATANGIRASLLGQSCTGVSNRSIPGFGRPFS